MAVICAEVIVKGCVFNLFCKYTCVGRSVGFVTVNILSKFIIDVSCSTCFITGCSEELCVLLAEGCSWL